MRHIVLTWWTYLPSNFKIQGMSDYWADMKCDRRTDVRCDFYMPASGHKSCSTQLYGCPLMCRKRVGSSSLKTVTHKCSYSKWRMFYVWVLRIFFFDFCFKKKKAPNNIIWLKSLSNGVKSNNVNSTVLETLNVAAKQYGHFHKKYEILSSGVHVFWTWSCL